MKSENLIHPERIYSVSEITHLIKRELESHFSLLWVEGEISDFTRAQSGHFYFTLKDKASQLSAVMWRSSAQKIPFSLESGLHVVCKGRINVYEPRGQYQLQVDLIEPKGKGALQLAFEQLKEKLNKEGLFSQEAKTKLPVFPKKVGLVTSPRGAAIVDIIRTLESRFARLHIVLYPVKVQGEGAAEEIAQGIDYFGSSSDIDVIIIGRGGGSMEDLWAFNDERVARAIFRCPVPIISAVGHEVDFTIADFVADVRASTPTKAAELVIEKEELLVEGIENLERRLIHWISYMVTEKKNLVLNLIHHHAFRNFKERLFNLIQAVDELEVRAYSFIRDEQREIARSQSDARLLEEKLFGLIRGKIQGFSGRWEKLAAKLHSLSPLNILKKGYALCWKDKGHSLVRNVEEVTAGEEMTVSFYKGEFVCQVNYVDKDRYIVSRTHLNKSG